MNKVDAIIAAFIPHIGKTITYTPHKDLPEKRRDYAKFCITEANLQLTKQYNLDTINTTIANTTNEVWSPISNIYWGQGYYSTLYGNAEGIMFATNGNNPSREYVIFDSDLLLHL